MCTSKPTSSWKIERFIICLLPVLGNLERVDLTGNMHLSGTIFPSFLDFKKHGKPILVVPPHLCTSVPYDDDP
jgi:hypothetical protein